MTKPILAAQLTIQDWVQSLARIPAEAFTQENVQHHIHHHAIIPSSLEPYTYFSPKRYTRNLIFKNDVFECLALCWDIGQASSIHDHADKLGWIYLVTGRLFVQSYRLEQRDPSRRSCRLIATDSAELGGNPAAYVDREQAIHKVSNLARFRERAISVHIYQQPLSECEAYSLETGTYEVVQLSYTSEFGHLNPGINLDS